MNVYTGGTFDLFHVGHVNLLNYCRRFAGDGLVIVGLNTDEFVEEYKKKRPVMSYDERRMVLESTKMVDLVVPNTYGKDSYRTIKEFNELEFHKKNHLDIHAILIGSDWHEKDYLEQMSLDWDKLRTLQIGLIYVPYTKDVSTTDVKQRVRTQ